MIGALGSILNTAIKVGGTAFGLSKAAKEMGAAADIYKQGKKDAYADRDRFYNEDATQRADAQYMLTKTAELLKQREKAAENVKAITGGTKESAAAKRAVNAQVLADTASQIAVAGAQRKDEIQDAFQKRKDAYDMAEADLHKNAAGQISKAVGGLWDTTNNVQKNMG